MEYKFKIGDKVKIIASKRQLKSFHITITPSLIELLKGEKKITHYGIATENGKPMYMMSDSEGWWYSEEFLEFSDKAKEKPMKELEPDMIICGGCSEHIHTSYVLEDVSYCQSCYDEKTFCCQDCGEINSNDYVNTIGDYQVCDSCFSNNYFNCNGCDENYHIDEYSEDGYCNGCHSHNDSENSLHCHSYKPTPQFFKLNSESKFYGIELEVERKDSDTQIDEMVEKINIDNIYCKSDGSLEDGIEIVTHPHSFEYLKKNKKIFDKILDSLKEADYRSYQTTTCGIHIHITKSAFNTWHLYRFMKFFSENKLFILKISQRKEEQLNQWASLGDLVQSKLLRKAKSKFEDGNRYQAINLSNRKTIEIRIFRGTLHIDSFYKNIEFLESLYQFTLDNEARNVTLEKYVNYVTKHKKLYNNLFNWLVRKAYVLTLDNVKVEQKKQTQNQ